MSNPTTSLFDRPVSEQAGLWLVSALSVFALVWFVLLSPKLSEQRELRNALELQEDLLKKEPHIREELEALERTLAENLTAEAEMLAAFVTAADVEVVLSSVSQAAHDSSVLVRSVERQKEIEGEIFVDVPLRISIDGSYSQVEEFLRRVSSLSKLLLVTRLTIYNSAVDGARTSLSVDCLISAYRALEDGGKPSGLKR
jgi:type IV pilus assembly protein PilO